MYEVTIYYSECMLLEKQEEHHANELDKIAKEFNPTMLTQYNRRDQGDITFTFKKFDQAIGFQDQLRGKGYIRRSTLDHKQEE